MGRPGARRAICSMVLVSLTVALPASIAHAAPAGNWHVASTLALGTDDTAIACPSTMVCWALEAGQLLSSNDGGATWTNETALVPSDVAALHDIDCPLPVRCYITATGVDGSSVALTESQHTIVEHVVPHAGALVSLSCAQLLRCVATDGKLIWESVNGSGSWTSFTLPTTLSPAPDLACVRGTFVCTLVGDRGETPVVLRTTNSGTTWETGTAPSPTDGLYSVTCPSVTTCFAGGATFSDDAAVIVTTNRGKTWSFASVPSQAYAVRSISCASETACSAIGASPARTPFLFATTDGRHFDAQTLPAVELERPAAIACPSPTRCGAVAGGISFFTDDAGAHWSSAALPAGVEAPQSLSCPTTTECVAVGNDAVARPSALTSADGGATWAVHALPAGTGGLLAVECPTPTACIALATASAPGTNRQRAQALRSTDGGVTWTLGVLADRRGVLTKLTCPSRTTCIASGYDNLSNAKLEVTTDGGRHWSSLAAPDDVFTINAVGCSAVDACIVIGGNPNAAPQAYTTSDLGATFHPHPVPYADAGNVYFNDVGCAGQTCVAVGEYFGSGVIMRSRDAGATWRASRAPDAAQIIDSVSCGSPWRCGAATFDFRQHGGPVVVESTNAGRTWRAFPVPARQETPLDVACHARGCVASDVSSAGNPIIVAGDF
ncbi:MAG TPA: hypothetical protein VH914_03680 [Acidimicrobiia bacterium]|nr:hypothetical protein [Acidimicrobiia bacterium]